MKCTRVFQWTLNAYTNKLYRIIANRGATRSSKTFSTLQLLYLIAINNYNLRISVVAESVPHLKRGALRDFKQIIESENYKGIKQIKESEHIYIFKSGSFIEFFSSDDAGKLRGSQRDICFINECNRLDYESFKQLSIRTSQTMFLDFNPVKKFWIDNLKTREDFIEFKSTYLDNDFLSEEQVREIESNKNDKKWWAIYGLGEYAKSEGLVYQEYDIYKDEIDRGEIIFGLDFGYKDPTALVKCRIYDNSIYTEELLYESYLSADEIVKKCKDILPNNAKLICDNARPEIIAQLKKAGINAIACKKGPNSIIDGIQLLKSYKLFIKGKHLENELDNYSWEEDKNGDFTDTPIDSDNHLLDAMRYAVTYNRKGPNGKYSIKTI